MMTLATMMQEGNLAGLRRWLADAGTLEVAEELVRLPPADCGVPFRLLAKDRALAVFEPDDRARLLDEMPAAIAQRLSDSA